MSFEDQARLAPARVIDTARLRLEPARREHAEALFALLQDPLLYRFIEGGRAPSMKELARCFERAANGEPFADGHCLFWIAEARDEHRYVGLHEAYLCDRRRASLGYLTFTSAAGRGYAREASLGILRYLFEERSVAIVFADVAASNIAARKVAEGIGLSLSPDAPPEPGMVRYERRRSEHG